MSSLVHSPIGKKKILLSIGIIFKNEIRSLERCLKALEPIREAIPCEVVMADTGSSDGSREIAAKYADILIDFPWINDFAAARNAVMDQCSGEWYLTVDSDEYLDKDVSQLVSFLQSPESRTRSACAITIRNYPSYEMDESVYSDFFAARMVRMDTGARYVGAIHESWTLSPQTRLQGLKNVILHHDGYAAYADGGGRDKLDRNMSLLRKKLEDDPGNLLTLLQIIESGWAEPEYLSWIRQAVERIKNQEGEWKAYGPPILRYAVSVARDKKLPELEDWAKLAEENFPDSYFIRIDVNAKLVLEDWDKGRYVECIRRGKEGLAAYADYRAGRGNIGELMFSTLSAGSPFHEQTLRTLMSNAYLMEGQMDQALSMLETLDFKHLDEGQTRNLVFTIRDIHYKSQLDTAPLVKAAWEGISEPIPNRGRAERRKAMFITSGENVFPSAYRIGESIQPGFQRHAYTAFLPLAGQCGLGTAAAILQTDNRDELTVRLKTIEKWPEVPIAALAHAIFCGIGFPLPGRLLKIEEMDVLCARLTQEKECLLSVVKRQTADGGLQSLTWARGLTLAAVRACNWGSDPQRAELARKFVEIERAYISRNFQPELLCGEQINLLPAMHRFGWYCAQAFDALEAGDTTAYVRLLREALTSYEGAKPMVEFLLENTPELQTPPPSPELLELAEKVRTMLAAYSPNDPAVAALKESPVYQRAAHLIEEP